MLKVILLVFLFSLSLKSFAKTPLISESITIDFSKSEAIFSNKVYQDNIKKFANNFAKEGSVSKKPLVLDSINMVINPVIQSEKYQLHFRFNLRADDGVYFNCVGVTNKKFEIFSAGCFEAISLR